MPRQASSSKRSLVAKSEETRTTPLVSQKSNFSSNVTLFTLNTGIDGAGPSTSNSVEDGPSTNKEIRRSPRKRVKVESYAEDEVDIEDAAETQARVSPLVALRNRLAAQQAGGSGVGGDVFSGKGRGKMKVEKEEETVRVVKKEEDDSEESTSSYASELLQPTALISSPSKLSRGMAGKTRAHPSEERQPPEDEPEGSASSHLPSTPSPKKSKTKSPAKPKTPKAIPTALETPHPAPENWEEVYDLIKEMRSTIIAPVDTMGCDQAQFKETDPRNRRFATLVSLMLSSQTKDEVTDAAVTKLRAAVGGTLSIENIINADDSVIAEAIGKVGFWRRKTEYIKKAAIQLRDKFGSDIPKTADELCSLSGVGPKMAFLALQVAWDLNLGIGVDVHVHRITNRLGWHKKSTKTPEETRLNLQSWLPKDKHREINHMLVGFGQVRCLPVGPKCNECVLYSKGLCPTGRAVPAKKTTATSRKRKVVEVEVEDGGSVVAESSTIMKEEVVDLDDKSLLKIEKGDVKMEDGDI